MSSGPRKRQRFRGPEDIFVTLSGNFLNDVDPLETLTYLEAQVDTLTRVKHVERKF